jgi:hypothetical protein
VHDKRARELRSLLRDGADWRNARCLRGCRQRVSSSRSAMLGSKRRSFTNCQEARWRPYPGRTIFQRNQDYEHRIMPLLLTYLMVVPSCRPMRAAGCRSPAERRHRGRLPLSQADTAREGANSSRQRLSRPRCPVLQLRRTCQRYLQPQETRSASCGASHEYPMAS